MSETPLFMLEFALDRAGLVALGRRRKVPLRDADEGYLAHLALRAIFGDLAPQPFALRGTGRRVTVLGYSAKDKESLLETAQHYSNPADFEVLCSGTTASKAMPQAWPERRTFGFEVRVCPVVRKSKDGPRFRKGAEVDAFLSRCWEAGEGVPVDREEVYRNWLSGHMERNGAVQVLESRMDRFKRERLARSNHATARQLVRCERPDATLSGTLQVRDSDAFTRLLARGIGRHRAFGFGMLLLRPA